MSRTALLAMLGLALALLSASCASAPEVPLRQEVAVVDRQRDWALVYYQSWLRHRDPDYLRLSRDNMAGAVVRYFRLQVKIGHSYPDFYAIDRRRVDGCQFLREIALDAEAYRVKIDPAREGCLR
ncbi:MAG: hypothetical protein HY423_08335 [Candidatus Lambdaproteobacteria bacterium]|nr:hypothetical protein [Candidatus Lambdaproteobacteria bacterium]